MVDLALLQSVSYIAGALGVCVAAFYYVMTLRVQRANMKATLETRQASLLQNYMQIGTTQYFTEAWHDLVFKQNYLTMQEWREKYGSEHPEHYTKLAAMLNYYNGLGGLIRRGLVSLDLATNIVHPLHMVAVWERLEPVVKGFRVTYKDDSIYSDVEYLYDIYMRNFPEMSVIKDVWHEQNLRRHDGIAPIVTE